MRELQLELIATEGVEEYWPVVEGWLVKFPDVWEEGPGLVGIRQALLTNDYRLWVLLEGPQKVVAVGLTELWQVKNGLVLKCFLGIGENLDLMMGALEGMETFAQQHGCSYFDIIGRPGWVKPLKRRGYKEVRRHFRKPLQPSMEN